jgi:hypothetical protein
MRNLALVVAALGAAACNPETFVGVPLDGGAPMADAGREADAQTMVEDAGPTCIYADGFYHCTSPLTGTYPPCGASNTTNAPCEAGAASCMSCSEGAGAACSCSDMGSLPLPDGAPHPPVWSCYGTGYTCE